MPQLQKKVKHKRLTVVQKRILDKLKQMPGSFLRIFRSRSGTNYFRLMDGKLNPVTTFRYKSVQVLINLDLIYFDGETYKLKR